MLRQPMVVRQGQNVRVVSGGAGFQVSGEGRAMANALAGQVVQVRLASGQVISGIAQNDGSIAVAH
jgi:flagella basal body P-ring formation protein FlgA